MAVCSNVEFVLRGSLPTDVARERFFLERLFLLLAFSELQLAFCSGVGVFLRGLFSSYECYASKICSRADFPFLFFAFVFSS